MTRELANQSQALAGTERYGTVHGTEVRGLMPVHVRPGIELAPPSGVGRKNNFDPCTGVTERGKNCKAPRANGTQFCAGHLRKMGLLEKKEKPVQE